MLIVLQISSEQALEILEIKEEADENKIRKAYFKLAQKYHPGKFLFFFKILKLKLFLFLFKTRIQRVAIYLKKSIKLTNILEIRAI